MQMTEEENSDAKRSKPGEANGKMKTEQNGDPGRKQPPEPPKDYIHVRARRGQATDAHSLAERVGRTIGHSSSACTAISFIISNF